MNLPKYKVIPNEIGDTYTFVSEGKKGMIYKIISFQEIEKDLLIVLVLKLEKKWDTMNGLYLMKIDIKHLVKIMNGELGFTSHC